MLYSAKDISVLIPTYNRPEEIRECLESIRTQTRPPKEVVIVDASEDTGTKSVVETFQGSDFSIRYFRAKPDKIAQRNYGIQQASGDLVQLSDDDIIFATDYFEKVEWQLREIEDERFGGFIGSIFESAAYVEKTKFLKAKSKISSILHRVFLNYPLGDGRLLKSGQYQLIRNVILGDAPRLIKVMGGAGCYRKVVFNKVHFAPFFCAYAAGEDIAFSIEVSSLYNLYYIPEAILVHKHLGGTNRSFAEAMQDQVKLLRYIFIKFRIKHQLSAVAHVWSLFGLLLYASMLKFNFRAVFLMIRAIVHTRV